MSNFVFKRGDTFNLNLQLVDMDEALQFPPDDVRRAINLTGEITFIVEPGILILSSSAYRDELKLIYQHRPDMPKSVYTVPAMKEVPAIDTGDFPPDLLVNLIIKGTIVGRGGDGGAAHAAYRSGTSNTADDAYTKTRRDGYAGAPGLLVRHSKVNLIIDGGIVARGGSGGGATPSGLSNKYGYGLMGVPGGGGAPYGRVLTNVPVEQEVPRFRAFFDNNYIVDKVSDATFDTPGKGYQKLDSDYSSPVSGNGGGWGQRGINSANVGTWNWSYHGTLEGLAGPGGPAIIGVPLLTLQIINGGQILQTL